MGEENCIQSIRGETQGIKEHIEDLDVNGRILKRLFNKWKRGVDWVDVVEKPEE